MKHISTTSEEEKIYTSGKEDVSAKYDGNGETILLIEDEESIVEITTILLKIAGYNVISAKNGIEGVEIFTELRDTINLIICDLNMPKLGGHTLVRKLIALQPEVKVLIISGSIEEDAVPTYLEPGKIAFLHKPFSNEMLLESLYSLLHNNGI